MIIEASKNPYVKEKLHPLDGAVEAINAYLEEYVSSNSNVLLLLSGGSSLDVLDKINTSLVGYRVTISPLDERYSVESSVNNMAQIAGSEFFKKAYKNSVNVIDTRVKENESQDELAARFNSSLTKWFIDNPDGKVIATLGIGLDGHISGMMPYPKEPEKFKQMFEDGDEGHLVIGYDAGDKTPFSLRVTTTMNLLKKIDVGIVYAVGDNKREALSRVLAEDGGLATTPARILREIEGKVFLFTDQT